MIIVKLIKKEISDTTCLITKGISKVWGEVGGGEEGMELCGWYIIIIWEGLINNQEK